MDDQEKKICWIATRVLQAEGTLGTKFIVKVGVPEQESEHQWRCPYVSTESKEKTKIQWAYSVDALGALLNAIMGVRKNIDENGMKLIWLEKKMGHGVPRFIPNVISLELTEHLEKMVEEEVKKHVNEMDLKMDN